MHSLLLLKLRVCPSGRASERPETATAFLAEVDTSALRPGTNHAPVCAQHLGTSAREHVRQDWGTNERVALVYPATDAEPRIKPVSVTLVSVRLCPSVSVSIMPRLSRRWVLLGLGAAALAGAAWYYLTEDEDEGDFASGESPGEPVERGRQSSGESKLKQQQVDINAHVDAHFQAIQAIARDTTVATLLGPLAENVKVMDDMDDIIGRLQRDKRSLTTAEKLLLWQSVLERVLCRFVCAVWLVPTLHLTIRVQLNVLGRTLYLESSLSDGPTASDDPRTATTREGRRKRHRMQQGTVLSLRAQEAFLTLGEHVGVAGYLRMRDMVRDTAVAAAAALSGELGSVGARTSVALLRASLGGVLATFERERLDEDGWESWEAVVAPSDERVRELLDDAQLTPAERFEVEGMWRETLGMYRSEAFRRRYLGGSARVLAAAMLRRIRVDVVDGDIGDMGEDGDDETLVPLVTLLPLVAREVERSMDAGSEYYALLSEEALLEAMSAQVYANGTL